MLHSEADQLETSGRWRAAADFWRQRYSETNDPEAAVRLAFVCWYVLAEHGCILDVEGLGDEDFARFEATLHEVMADALTRHTNNADVLFHFGYMAALFPWYFDSDDVSGWEQRASELLRRASEMRPDNPVFEMAYLSDLPESERPEERYKAACRRARPVVAARYDGEGEFDDYFGQVLNRAA